MKQETKKILCRILKIIWIAIGISISFVAISLWIKLSSLNGSGMSGIGAAIGLALLVAASIYFLLIYIGITLLFLFIKWLIKKIRKRKNNKISHEHKFSGKVNRKLEVLGTFDS